MEPSCDTKAQILIFAINFATREKKKNKTKKHKHSIPLECNSDNPLKMIPNKKKLTIQNTKIVAPVEHRTTTTKINLVPCQG